MESQFKPVSSRTRSQKNQVAIEELDDNNYDFDEEKTKLKKDIEARRHVSPMAETIGVYDDSNDILNLLKLSTLGQIEEITEIGNMTYTQDSEDESTNSCIELVSNTPITNATRSKNKRQSFDDVSPLTPSYSTTLRLSKRTNTAGSIDEAIEEDLKSVNFKYFDKKRNLDKSLNARDSKMEDLKVQMLQMQSKIESDRVAKEKWNEITVQYDVRMEDISRKNDDLTSESDELKRKLSKEKLTYLKLQNEFDLQQEESLNQAKKIESLLKQVQTLSLNQSINNSFVEDEFAGFIQSDGAANGRMVFKDPTTKEKYVFGSNSKKLFFCK